MPGPERKLIDGLHGVILMLRGIAVVLLHPLPADMLHGELPQQRRPPLAQPRSGSPEIADGKASRVGINVVHFVLAGIKLLCAVRHARRRGLSRSCQTRRSRGIG